MIRNSFIEVFLQVWSFREALWLIRVSGTEKSEPQQTLAFRGERSPLHFHLQTITHCSIWILALSVWPLPNSLPAWFSDSSSTVILKRRHRDCMLSSGLVDHRSDLGFKIQLYFLPSMKCSCFIHPHFNSSFFTIHCLCQGMLSAVFKSSMELEKKGFRYFICSGGLICLLSIVATLDMRPGVGRSCSHAVVGEMSIGSCTVMYLGPTEIQQ